MLWSRLDLLVFLLSIMPRSFICVVTILNVRVKELMVSLRQCIHTVLWLQLYDWILLFLCFLYISQDLIQGGLGYITFIYGLGYGRD